MANFAVRLVHGPGWDSSRQIRDQEGWDEHAAFMDGLVGDGFVIIGGPVGAGEQTLHVVEAADESEIKARLAGDPLGVGRAAPDRYDRALGALAGQPPGEYGALIGTYQIRCVLHAAEAADGYELSSARHNRGC
jgi:hypothetical protein